MNGIDRLVATLSPERALRRVAARQQLTAMSSVMSNPSLDPTPNHAGSFARRALRSWVPWLFRNPDDEVLHDRQLIVARTRDAYRNQPIARAAVNTYLTSVVGSGLVMHCTIDRDYLGFTSDAEATAWERKTERLFKAWANSTDADARRRNTFYRLQRIAYKSALHSGEVFAVLPLIRRKGTVCDLRVQLVETDRVSTPMDKMDGTVEGNSLWDGIETGKFGEPVAYYIETTPPSQTELVRTWQRTLAYGTKTGRRQVIHFYEEERPGQRRGLPFLTPILEPLKQIAKFTEAELMAAVISSMFTVFVKKDVAGVEPLGEQVSEADETSIELAPGAVVDLNAGESIEVAESKRPNPDFGPFLSEILQQIGMALNLPYEVLIKRFQSSYSASRAAIIQAWEVFKTEREWFASQFLDPIYEEWLAQMVATGQIDAPGFFDDVMIRRAYCACRWYGPVAPQLDPVKEVTAACLRMEAMLSTLAEETERFDGGDWEANLRQRKREQDTADQLGLNLVTTAFSSQTKTVSEQSPPDPNNPE